jgi:hypothetical protein
MIWAKADPLRKVRQLSDHQGNEYSDAVAPLENLRKLNRGKFEEILSNLRRLRVRPPLLQSLLYHFDSKPDSMPAAGLPKDLENLAAALVAAFLRHGEMPNVQVDAKTLEATYRLQYSASNGQKVRSGSLRQEIRYTNISRRWLVTGIRTVERLSE